ncbi:MAG: hypothetical protein AAF938_05585 [Myxococcota bacterium]
MRSRLCSALTPALVSAWLVAIAPPLRAQPAPSSERAFAQLHWQGPPGCVQEQEVAREVERRLGRAVFDTRAAVEIRGSVRSAASGTVAQIELWVHGNRTGERRLQTRGRCRRLDEALFVIVALLIEQGAESVRLRVPAGPVPEVSALPAPATTGHEASAQSVNGPRPAQNEPSPSRPVGVGISVGADMSLDWLPGFATAAHGALALLLARGFSLEFTGAFGARGSTSRDEQQLAASGWLVGGGPCFTAARGRWSLGGCVSLRGGRVRGDGSGFDDNRSADLSVALAGAWARARFDLWRWTSAAAWVGADIGVEGALRATRFVAQNASLDVLHRVGPVIPSLRLAIGLRIR